MMEQGDSGKGSITAVVLAGGQGNRMGGQDKGLLAFHGRPLIEHILDGLRPQVAADRMLRLLPELKEVCQIEYRELMSLDSSNLLPEHWQRMACSVAELREDYDGFVISHGTDTMAYSASSIPYDSTIS